VSVRRSKDGASYRSASPLTRDELSLVAEHFDAAKMTGLLPGKSVNVNDTWPIRDEVVSALCSFDGLVRQTLTAKLVEVKDHIADFTIEGEAEGVENGAKAKLTIAARAQFDLTSKHLANLTWEQIDDREAGPISPAMKAKAKITAVRTEEGGRASQMRRERPVWDDKHVDQLLYRHPEGKYELLHHRDWHAVVQTDSHLVMRFVVRGEMIAQATIASWKKSTAATREDAIREFIDATAKTPGWTEEKKIASVSMPASEGLMIYRHTASGKQDNAAVVQSFYLITAADGRQVTVTSVSTPQMEKKLGTADAAIAEAIRFPAAK
jgi:hypothetical protein